MVQNAKTIKIFFKVSQPSREENLGQPVSDDPDACTKNPMEI
jgi:hypothetical protein